MASINSRIRAAGNALTIFTGAFLLLLLAEAGLHYLVSRIPKNAWFYATFSFLVSFAILIFGFAVLTKFFRRVEPFFDHLWEAITGTSTRYDIQRSAPLYHAKAMLLAVLYTALAGLSLLSVPKAMDSGIEAAHDFRIIIYEDEDSEKAEPISLVGKEISYFEPILVQRPQSDSNRWIIRFPPARLQRGLSCDDAQNLPSSINVYDMQRITVPGSFDIAERELLAEIKSEIVTKSRQCGNDNVKIHGFASGRNFRNCPLNSEILNKRLAALRAEEVAQWLRKDTDIPFEGEPGHKTNQPPPVNRSDVPTIDHTRSVVVSIDCSSN